MSETNLFETSPTYRMAAPAVAERSPKSSTSTKASSSG